MVRHSRSLLFVKQSQGSPATPVNSNSNSVSDPSGTWIISEELDSGAYQAYYPGEKDPTGDYLSTLSHLLLSTFRYGVLIGDSRVVH